MINDTKDTVYYGWGHIPFTDTLPPGGKAYCEVGHIKVQYDMFGEKSNSSTWWVNFQCERGNYHFEVDQCLVEYKLEQ